MQRSRMRTDYPWCAKEKKRVRWKDLFVRREDWRPWPHGSPRLSGQGLPEMNFFSFDDWGKENPEEGKEKRFGDAENRRSDLSLTTHLLLKRESLQKIKDSSPRGLGERGGKTESKGQGS